MFMGGDGLQFASFILGAFCAVQRVVAQQEIERCPAQSLNGRAGEVNGHPVDNLFRACRDRPSGATCDLYEAEAARCRLFFKPADCAQVGDIETVVQCGPQQVCSTGSFDLFTLYDQCAGHVSKDIKTKGGLQIFVTRLSSACEL